MYKLFYILYIIILTFNLSSCTKMDNLNGYIMKSKDFTLLRKNISTKDNVKNIFGSPSIQYNINDNLSTNIFLYQNISNFLFFKPIITERKIIVINFNKDIISSINQYNLTNQNKISYYNDYNKNNNITQKSFLSEIFSNIGQITPN
ncbi:MAG: hypothetical protein CMP18_00355 [Rickettsiales bacterium]|jgi:outer membrane protein assembly factor BamE (lipoprotein component of BamABCDE complex)|nr:hypothetical protein [Rickettsiales bacterium]